MDMAQTNASSQNPAEPAGAPAASVEAQLALVEQSVGRPLTQEQRDAVAAKLTHGAVGRSEDVPFVVPDGTEPGFIFRPVPLDGGSRGQGARDEGAHG